MSISNKSLNAYFVTYIISYHFLLYITVYVCMVDQLSVQQFAVSFGIMCECLQRSPENGLRAQQKLPSQNLEPVFCILDT